MRPLDIQQIGHDLAIRWEDGSESFIGLEQLRRACPCAGCKGEMDVMGNVYKGPERPLGPEAFRMSKLQWVGGYAIQPVWADGHSTGLYSFDYLRRVAESAP
jgi:DUF971 family protein